MVSALAWVSMALIKYHEQKQLGEERFILPLWLQSVIRRSQGRNLEAGSEAEAVGKHYLLVCPVSFLIQYRTHLSRDITGLPIAIISQENAPPQTCLPANLMEAIPQLRPLLPRQV